jgi:hypothetical protein
MDDTATTIEEGSPTVATVGAILAVDIGSLYTRAAMFDVVGDEYRFVARASAVTTAESPNNDVTAGVYTAVRELEQITGRTLTDETRLLMPQRADGHGIDLFIATSSAAPALRLVVAAVSQDISQVSAMRAARGTYTQVMSSIALDAGMVELPSEEELLLSTGATAWLQAQGDKLLALPPDVVLMAGGVDNGPVAPLVRLAHAVSGAAREQSRRAEAAGRVGKTAPGMPTVLFAGNPAALDRVSEALAPISEIIRDVPNVRPTLDMEQVAPATAALSSLYMERRVPEIPGYSVLSRWVEGGVVPTADAERLIARYLYRHYGRETLLVDVGATSTTLMLANATRDEALVLGDVGLGYGLGNLLAERGAANIMRWLPFDIDEAELTDWILNKVVRPLTLPQTARDLAIEHALAREALQLGHEGLTAGTTNSWAPHAPHSTLRYDLLVGTGGLLAHAPRPGQAALLLLDALQPTGEGLGSVELAVDGTLLVPALGNLARHHLGAASYIFDRDCLQWLGTAIVPVGRPPDGRRGHGGAGPTAVTVTVERQKGESMTVEVAYGTITVVPLRPDQRAALTVKPAAGFSVGGGEPGKALKTERGQEVKGGLVGLIIDARGRPIELPTEARTRRTTIQKWWSAVDAVPSGETFMTGMLDTAGLGSRDVGDASQEPEAEDQDADSQLATADSQQPTEQE